MKCLQAHAFVDILSCLFTSARAQIVSARLNCALKTTTPWPESASELYRPSDRRLPAKLVPNFADRDCRVVSVTDPYGSILGFLDRGRYFFFQVAPRLYSRG
jgi:hypothetical protein